MTADAAVELSGGPEATVLEYRAATRREVLERLLAGRGTKITWTDEGYASEKVDGRITGQFGEVLSRFLRTSNFVIIYREAANSRQISEIILLGSRPGGGTSPSLRAIEIAFGPNTGTATLTPEQKLGKLAAEEIDQIAISSREYLRRTIEQGLWQQNAANAHLDQLARMAGAGYEMPQGLLPDNASAGLPPYYIEPSPTDPNRYADKGAALTQMMALRGLAALRGSLDAVGPPLGTDPRNSPPQGSGTTDRPK